MKTVVIISHPELTQSSSQQFFLAALEGEDITVHHLDSALVDGHFDKQQERALLREADRIILQFPLYWYQVPAVMKQWIDEVLSTSCGAGKELGIVVTIGAKKEDYRPGGTVGFTVGELLRPLQALAHYFNWQYLPPFEVYQFDYLTETRKQALLVDYLFYLERGAAHSLADREAWLLERADHYHTDPWAHITQWLTDQRHDRDELAFLLSEMEDTND